MKSVLLLVSLSLASIGFAGIMAGPKLEAPPPPDLEELLRPAGHVIVYEGLPNDPVLVDSEIRSKPTFAFAGDRFYAPPLALDADSRRGLESLVRTGIAVPFSGHKLCGGFHANFMLEWELPEDRFVRALLCFGCREIKFVVDSVEVLCDMKNDSVADLRTFLVPHIRHRPPPRDRSAPPPPLIPLPPPKFDVKM